jgi:leader peptidase (prepilin peptidase)/N-methyltransferase
MLLTYFEDATLTLAALPAPLHFCIAAIYGVVIGSFLTVVVHRLPIMLERAWQEETRLEDGVPLSQYNLCLPRSACTDCGKVLKPWHNVPVLSYLALWGRCGFCGVRISARYLLLELATGALSIGVVWRFGWTWHALAAFGRGS